MMTLFYRSLPRGKGMMDDSLESVGISVWGVRRSGIGQRRLSGIMGNIQSICFSMYYMTCFFYHLFFHFQLHSNWSPTLLEWVSFSFHKHRTSCVLLESGFPRVMMLKRIHKRITRIVWQLTPWLWMEKTSDGDS